MINPVSLLQRLARGRIPLLSAALAGLVALALNAAAAESPAAIHPPLKVLLLTGGGYHDYKTLVPRLTNEIGKRVLATFDVRFDIESLHDPKFADQFDAVIYDICFDEAPDDVLENAIQATKKGKPTVMIHCAVHAFRHSPKIHEWETCCGMRSKVHDRFEGFTVQKLDPESPITKFFPQEWSTAGDELYQTISIDPDSHQLLKAKSPQDGRVHVVCWTYQFGKGRVFSTTLGHDLKTAGTPEYLRLLSNGLLWACDKLDANGEPAAGFSAAPPKP